MTIVDPASGPRVTIMIPTYNQAAVIDRAVDSALAQDYPNLEVLVIDDCSSDDTRSMMERRSEARLKFRRNPANLGRVRNYRHALYELAGGEWIVNLDGDDYFIDSGFVTAAVRAASSSEEIVIVAARAEVHTQTKRSVTSVPSERLLDGREVVMRAARREYHFMHLASMYRRSAALALDFYRTDVISSDWEALYRLACHGKVAFIDRVAGVWNVSSSGDSQTPRWQSFARNMGIWAAIREELIACGVDAGVARRSVNRTMVSLGNSAAAHLLKNGKILDTFRFILRMDGASSWVKARLLLHYELMARLLISLASAVAFGRRPACAG